MTTFDMTWFFFFGDRFFGGDRFFFSSGYSRLDENENEILLRSDCEVTEAEMTVFTNTANNPFEVGIRKNGDGINNSIKDESTISWLANELATKVWSPQPLFYDKDDRICLRMSGPSSWSPNNIEFRIKMRIQFTPVP